MPGTNLTRAEAEARAAIVSTEAYVIELDLTTTEDTFRSISTVTFTATAGERRSSISSRQRCSRSPSTARSSTPRPTSRTAASRCPTSREHNELTVVANCAYMNTGEGLHRFVDPEDGEVYLYSQFEVADTRRVYAVFEQPDLKATFQFTVTAPKHWHVISNSPTPEASSAAVPTPKRVSGTSRPPCASPAT